MGGGSEDFLIIPQPRFMERRPGMCLIRGGATATTVDPSLHADLGDEGYRLSVSPGGVVIRAATAAGAFYAGQTLRQLLPPRSEHEGGEVEHSIPCVEIEDGPRFTWRGCMLDEGRSFHGTETVKLLLDLMALHKLNVFHWHLTEDQGWRIEIRAYPRLTTVGALRGGSMRAPRSRPDNLPYSGFYTQEEIREIVSYASERFITLCRRSISQDTRGPPWQPTPLWAAPADHTTYGITSASSRKSCARAARGHLLFSSPSSRK